VVATAPGVLQPLTHDQIRAAIERRQARRAQGMSNTMEALVAYAVKRHMRDPRGWAQHVWTARQRKREQRRDRG
jgi:uncharacterized protein YoaH (UPF0181 family)